MHGKWLHLRRGASGRPLLCLKVTNGHFSTEKWTWNGFNWAGVGGTEGYYCWNSTPRGDLNRRQSHQTLRFHHCTTLSHTFSNEIFGGRPFIKWLFSKRRTHWGKGVGRCAILFWLRKVLRFSIQNLIFWDGSINVIFHSGKIWTFFFAEILRSERCKGMQIL